MMRPVFEGQQPRAVGPHRALDYRVNGSRLCVVRCTDCKAWWWEGGEYAARCDRRKKRRNARSLTTALVHRGR